MKSVLAIDMGNTNTKYGLLEDGQLKAFWSHATADTQTAAASILEQSDAPVALASVVPASSEPIVKWCTAHGRQITCIASEKQSIISGDGGKLGADLLASVVAALKLYGGGADVIVIGLGTATTLTAVSADGKLHGVYVALGLSSTLETLTAKCALLPKLSDGLKGIDLGLDTESAMRNGTLLGHVGLVEAWVARSKQQIGKPVVTVATGGWSQTVAQHTKVFDHVDQHLTLKGICLLYDQLEAQGR